MSSLPAFLPSPLSSYFGASPLHFPLRTPPRDGNCRRNTPLALIAPFNNLAISADFASPAAKGSFGEIFFGHLSGGEPVVLKRAHSTPTARKLFRTERAINRKLEKAQIEPCPWPKFLGEYSRNSETFLVWHRWEDAWTLEDYIMRMPASALPNAFGRGVQYGGLNLVLFRIVVGGLLYALQELHGRKVVHRDVKPANVLVVPDAEHALQLIDFGSSCDVGGLLWRRGVNTLDPLYAAPEMRLNFLAPDRFDVFSAGLIGMGVLVREVGTEGGMKAFRRKLERCDFDMRRLREECLSGRCSVGGELRLLFERNDWETRAVFELLCGMLRKSPSGRKSARAALEELGL